MIIEVLFVYYILYVVSFGLRESHYVVLFARCNPLDFMLKLLLLTGYIELGVNIFYFEEVQCIWTVLALGCCVINPSVYFIFKHSTWCSHCVPVSFFTDIRKKQRLLSYTLLSEWFFVTSVESVYCAIRTEFFYKTQTFPL